MVNNSSVPPSCREVPRQCSQSDTSCPQVNACGPEPGLGDSVLLVTFDFFHVFVEEVSLWWCFCGEVDKGPGCWLQNLPAAQRRRTGPSSPLSRARWHKDNFRFHTRH